MMPCAKKRKRAKKKLDAEAKVRKKLIANPQVQRFVDAKSNWAVVRVLHRKGAPPLAEIGVKVVSGKVEVKEAVDAAGFTNEGQGKWVWRSNKFSVFIYV